MSLINNVGGKVKITIKKKDNSTFEDNEDEVSYEKDVSGDEVVISGIKLKQEWENIETDEIDEYIATVTYDNKEKYNIKNLKVSGLPEIIVDFRPDGYDQQDTFGFDYFSSSSKGDKIDYKSIYSGTKPFQDLKNEYNPEKLNWSIGSAINKVEYT